MGKKLTQDEQNKLRRENARKVSDNLKLQLLTITKQKNAVFAKLVECREKGLIEQEQQARGQLKQYMLTEKRCEGMLMSIELALSASDLNQLNIDFLKSMNDLSKSVTSLKQSKINMKQTKKNYLKALFTQERNKEATDEMLDLGNYAGAAGVLDNTNSEFDDQIDSMLDSATGIKETNKANDTKIKI